MEGITVYRVEKSADVTWVVFQKYDSADCNGQNCPLQKREEKMLGEVDK